MKHGEAGLLGAQAHHTALLVQTSGFEAGGECWCSAAMAASSSRTSPMLCSSPTPEWRGEFAHALLETLGFITAMIFWQKDRAVVGEAIDLAAKGAIPGASSHAGGDEGIE